MKLFPAFLDLAHRPCLVVGGGRVGLEKTKSLLAAGASVLVVDPEPSPDLVAEARREAAGSLSVERRAFHPRDCRGRVLVFACTAVPTVDAEVAAAARAEGVLCCRVDGVPCDFTTGATLRRGDLCLAVSSGAASPALAAEARDRAAEAVGPEYGEAANLLGEMRGDLRAAGRPRSSAMSASLVGDVLGALRSGDPARARALVEQASAAARADGARSEDSCTR